MPDQTVGGPEPTRRIVISVASLAVGVVVASFVGAAVLAGGGWDIDVPATIGSDVGRTVMQFATSQSLADHRVPLGVALLLNVPLWAAMVGGPLLARREGLDWRRDLGWSMRLVDVPVGLAVGVVTQLVLVPVLYIPIFRVVGDEDVGAAARSLIAAADNPFDVLALVILTGVGAPVVEEILFRGLMHRGIADMMSDWGRLGVIVAVVASSAVFAASHFQLLQFPALMMFGVIAALGFHYTHRLGTAIWIHIGFNLTTVVVLLSEI